MRSRPLDRMTVAKFRVREKRRGKWRTAKQTPDRLQLPAKLKYSVQMKLGRRWVTVAKGTGSKKSKGLRAKGLKKLITTRPAPMKDKSRRLSVDVINEKLGAQWAVRPRAWRPLPMWATKDGSVFYNTESDRRSKPLYVAIWYAIEADSIDYDGTTEEEIEDEPAETASYWVDVTIQRRDKRTALSKKTLESFRDLIDFSVEKTVQDHNTAVDQGKATFQWRHNFKLLAVEPATEERKRDEETRGSKRGTKRGARLRHKAKRPGATKKKARSKRSGGR